MTELSATAAYTTGTKKVVKTTKIIPPKDGIAIGTMMSEPRPVEVRTGIKARSVVAGIPGIEFIQFDDRDVVRHPLVQRIILAYDRHVAPRSNDEETRGGEQPADSDCGGDAP